MLLWRLFTDFQPYLAQCPVQIEYRGLRIGVAIKNRDFGPFYGVLVPKMTLKTEKFRAWLHIFEFSALPEAKVG